MLRGSQQRLEHRCDLMAYLDAAEIALRGRADLQAKIGLKITDRKAVATKAAKMKDEG